jgi:hypothetical protein
MNSRRKTEKTFRVEEDDEEQWLVSMADVNGPVNRTDGGFDSSLSSVRCQV